MNSDPWRAVTLGLCLMPIQPWSAHGAELPRADEATDYLAPLSMTEIHPRWTRTHRNEGAIVGDILVWPAATLGTVIDSNPFQFHTAARAAVGVQFAPSVLAERDTGVHRTLGYAAGDLRFFPGEGRANTTNGRAGVLHDWALRRDMTVRIQGEIARRTDPFNTTQLVSTSAQKGLLQQTSALGSLSVQRTFSRFFVLMSGSALRSSFDSIGSGKDRLGLRGLSDETVVTLKGRAGYWVAPALYAFAEPAANWRMLDAISRQSSGTRTVAGVGVTRFSLLNADVFAGWQHERYPVPGRGVSTSVVGGRVAWTPTRAWTVALEFDRSLGVVAAATVADPIGTPVRQSTAIATVGYALSPIWTARATLGAIWRDDVGTARRDRLVLADCRLDYAVSRSIDLSGAIRFTALRSSFAAAAYRRTDATLGATYHY